MAEAQIVPWQNKYFSEDSTQVLLNPALGENEKAELLSLAKQRDLKSHVWIASSGSSSSAENSVKLIALSKQALLSSAQAANLHLSVTGKDVWAQSLPTFHVGGLGIEARAFVSRAKVVNALKNGNSWEAEYFFQVLEKEKVTLASLVPTQVFDLVSKKLKSPPSLRAVVVGGAALAHELYLQARELGWPLLPSFGMTECCSQIATAKIENLSKNDSTLHLLSHLQARSNSEGFIEISGKSLLTEFAQMQKGSPVFVDPKKDGWLETADKGEVMGDILNLQGRAADFVKILGEGVNLSLLDQVLEKVLSELQIKNRQSFALIAAPDERAGAKIVLLLTDVNVGAKNILEIIKRFDQAVKPFEKIKEHHFVNEIPRSSLGKLLRQKLLDHFLKSN